MNVKKTLGIGIGAVIAGLGAYKYFTGKEPQKYSNKWFDTVSDEVLKRKEKLCENSSVLRETIFLWL